MKTKWYLMLIVACMAGTQVMNAQHQNGRRNPGNKRMTMEQIVSMQCNRIIQTLGLDDKTAAKFTDVYKDYMKEMDEARKMGMPKKTKEGKDFQVPTDDEVEKMMKDRFAQSRKILDIREKYYDKFRRFLSPKQVQKIYDQGQMMRGQFHREMNRRAGMKKMNPDSLNVPQRGQRK